MQNYVVRTFLCDADFNEIKNPAPVERDDEMIVCLQTDRETELQGVGIMKVNTFQFYKEQDGERTVTQKAVDAGAEMAGTVIDCPGGTSYCTFRTELRDNFFYTDGAVQGIGSVALESISDNNGRNLRTSRQTQEFVGLAAVNLYFDVEDGLNKKKINEARKSFREHWNEQPPEVQALYIIGVLVLLILICCVCAGLILWPHCCADTPGQWVRRMREGDEIHVMPPVDMNGKKEEENEETHSLDDSDVVPEEDEEESSDDEEQTYNSRRLQDESTTRTSRSSYRGKGNELVPYKSPSQRRR